MGGPSVGGPSGRWGGGERGGASLPLFKQSAERRPLGADAPHSSVLAPGGEEEEEEEDSFDVVST